MGELDDSFTQLLGRQPTDREKQGLCRVRDALKLKATDAVWLLLMALQHYETLYAEFPARISDAARDVTTEIRKAAESETRAAQAKAQKALMDAVHQAAVKSAARTAGAQLARWVTIGVGVVSVALALLSWTAYRRGEETGQAVGKERARQECGVLVAASAWSSTPEGQLAYAFAKAGGLAEVARCSGRGMLAREGSCIVTSDHGRVLARWSTPSIR